MADFKTHLIGAALMSGIAATGLAMTATISHQQAISYFVAGTAGGLMPDVDSESSVPIRIAYRVLSSMVALLTVLNFADRFSLLELTLLGLVSYGFVRYVCFSLFSRFTVHRGIVHSLPSAAGFGLITVIVAERFFAAGPLHAWLLGAFMTFGFLIHLALDEVYSIDLLGRRIKRSFGTALKVADFDNPIGSALLYGAVVVLFLMTPSARPFVDLMLSESTYGQLLERLVPRGDWFPGLLTAAP